MILHLSRHSLPMLLGCPGTFRYRLRGPGTKPNKLEKLKHQEYNKQDEANSDGHNQPQMAYCPLDSSDSAEFVIGDIPLLNMRQ